jgi:hypothetical protein
MFKGLISQHNAVPSMPRCWAPVQCNWARCIARAMPLSPGTESGSKAPNPRGTAQSGATQTDQGDEARDD